MLNFSEYIGSQFREPRGIIGKICCVVMNVMNGMLYNGVAASVGGKRGQCILDIGYGNGHLIKKLYKKCGAKIYGIDISEDMRAEASRRNRAAVEKGDVKLTVGDCCDLPFEDRAFDVVTSVNTIYFWGDTLKGLSEIRRVLKEGGVFYNAVYSKEWLQRTSLSRKGFAFFEKEDYVKLGKKAGFAKVGIKELARGKSYIVRYKI